MENLISAYIKWFDPKIKNWILIPLESLIFIYLIIKLSFKVIYFNEAFPNWINLFLDHVTFDNIWLGKIDQNDIAIIASFIAAILGIAIPISLSVISSLDEKYKQGGITREFLKEPINISQYSILLINILIILGTMFLENFNPYFSIIYLLFFLLSLVNFIAYILLIREYLVDAKSYILKKLIRELNHYYNEH